MRARAVVGEGVGDGVGDGAGVGRECVWVGMGEGEGEGEKEEPSEAGSIRQPNMHLHRPFILWAVLLRAVRSMTDGWIGPFPVSCSSSASLLVSFSVRCIWWGFSTTGIMGILCLLLWVRNLVLGLVGDENNMRNVFSNGAYNDNSRHSEGKQILRLEGWDSGREDKSFTGDCQMNLVLFKCQVYFS